MLKKFVIAAAAVASLVTLASVPAKADPQVSIGIGFGFGNAFGPDYGPGYGVYDDGFDGDYRPRRRPHWNNYRPRVQSYGVSCSTGANIVRNAGYRSVQAFDCSAPVYAYQARRHGEDFEIRVSSRGRIISVDQAY